MSKYTDIIERLEKATGPDRGLDCQIACALEQEPEGGMSIPFREWCALSKNDWSSIGEQADRYNSILRTALPRYTASIDAAVALVEKMLPGWAHGYDSGPRTVLAFVDANDFDERMFGARFTYAAKTKPLAILLALFKALKAKEGAE